MSILERLREIFEIEQFEGSPNAGSLGNDL